ncbi:MAG TPA: Ig-like domain-containing protein [Candidatus Limnocylindria bacterium]|nr:Ig-like domain-containing protein [Candidatus Limnocylindria bacterium]
MLLVAGFIVMAAALAQAASPITTTPQQGLVVRWQADRVDTDTFAIEVSELDAATARELKQANWNPKEWQRVLSVYAGQGDLLADVGVPPMLGTYSVEGSTLRFEPRFPLEPGVKYRATFNPGLLPGARNPSGKFIVETFQLPARSAPSTTVVSQIYPSANLLPENVLKFYVGFSAPMSRGHIYDHIHLRNEAGQPIELPFLEIDEELWNPEMTRLTLFLDPGRIKRGVRPLEEVGPALEQGKRYTLVIDRNWKDAAGRALKTSFEKAFAVGPPDRESPDPALWKIRTPKIGTQDPLVVIFSEPMDHALAQRVIRVVTPSGELVPGGTALREDERGWTFSPARPWQPGPYRMLVQTTIEDLAGNNIGKTFEVDVFDGVDRQFTNTTVKLSFDVR